MRSTIDRRDKVHAQASDSMAPYSASASSVVSAMMVLRMALEGLGTRLGFVPTEADSSASRPRHRLAGFPDSALPYRHCTPNISSPLSRIYDDLFAASAQRLQVQFDWIITAQQAQSYKPSCTIFM